MNDILANKKNVFLRYNPVTSLRAQLKAERFATEYATPTAVFPQLVTVPTSYSSPRAPPSPRPIEPTSSQRPYIELMSPRLTQRRTVLPPNYYRSTRYPAAHIPNGYTESAFDPAVAPVACGTTPHIWVPRKSTDSAMDMNALANNYPVINGHTPAYHTNSLPRLDRRHERFYHDENPSSR